MAMMARTIRLAPTLIRLDLPQDQIECLEEVGGIIMRLIVEQQKEIGLGDLGVEKTLVSAQ